MADLTSTRQFQRSLLSWFDQHARDLPWRRTSNPYYIWISEIMLQQTRVAAVLDHYARFLVSFPTVQSLAEAKEPAVLAAWSGLGYYRRARMMHKAAQVILQDHNGVLPHTAVELRSLPGIGDYTSSAIASIAFGEPVAVVDGNVERVLERAFPNPDSSAKTLRREAANLLDTQRPGDFNQAMMELGATLCLPQRPLCLHCPVQSFCATRGEHPVAPRKKMQTREVAYALLRRMRAGATQILLQQRPHSASLMPGMWELPEIVMLPSDEPSIEITLRHSITVTNYRVQVLGLTEQQAEQRLPQDHPRKWTKSAELAAMPLTGLARKALQRLQIMPAGV